MGRSDSGLPDIGIYRQGDVAILQVEDTGPGIPSGDIEKIFEPFFRGSRPAGEGAGLGLSIVKRIVDSLGGAIMLENIPGTSRSGLRATIQLRMVVGSHSRPNKGGAEERSPSAAEQARC